MQEVTFVIEGAEVRPVINIWKIATILELKQKIEQYTGIRAYRQTLLFGASELEDSDNINDHGFKDTTFVHLTVEPLPGEQKLHISVSAAALGFEMAFEVKENETVYELKKMIEGCLDVSPEDVALWHLDTEMKDKNALSQYYIHEGCKVNLRTPMLC